MATILIYPGQQGAPVALLDVLREAHEAARASRQAEIDARTKARIPLDDSTNWQEVGELVSRASLAHGERDSAKVASAARELVAATDGNAIEPLGDFVGDAALDGIVVTMQIVDDATRRLWNAQTQAAWIAIRDASKTADVMARREAYDRLERA